MSGAESFESVSTSPMADLYLYIFYFDFILFFLRAAPAAYASFQARGRIGATAVGLCHRHSSIRSESSV